MYLRTYNICTNNYNGLQYSSLTGYTCITCSCVYLESLYHELQQTLVIRSTQHKPKHYWMLI